MKDIKYRRNSFAEIVERIKDIISHKYPNKRILNKYVAEELGLSPMSLRVYKCKNIVPYDKIAYFCVKYGISFDWLVFDNGFKIKKFAELVKKD